MKLHRLKWVIVATLLLVPLLLFLGYGARKLPVSKAPVQQLRSAPPLAEFEMPPAHAPKTPFRLLWQQVNFTDKDLTVSPDWKFLALTHGATTTLVSTASGQVVKQGKNIKPLGMTPAAAIQPPKGQTDISQSGRVELVSQKAGLIAVRGYKTYVSSLASGRTLWSLNVPPYGPRVFMGFSPDGKWLLTREGDRHTQNAKHFLRDARTGTILRRFDWTSNAYYAPLGFSPNGRQFGVFDRGVRFYAMPSGKETFRYDGFTYGASNIEFSRDARTLVTSDSGDETVAVWNLSTGRAARFWHANYNASGTLAMSPDGKSLAAGSDGSCGRDLVRVWDFATAKERWVVPSGYNSYGVNDLQWSPDGTLLATASNGGPPQIWNARTGQRIAVLGGAILGKGTQATYDNPSVNLSKGFNEQSLFWSSDARELWVGGRAGIKIWSRDGAFLREITTVPKIASMSRCPSGQRVVIATTAGEIVLLHVKDETITWRKSMGVKYLAVAFLPSDRVISWDIQGDKIDIWDAKGGFTTQTLEAPLGTHKVDVSRDGKRLVSLGQRGIMLWETAPETEN